MGKTGNEPLHAKCLFDFVGKKDRRQQIVGKTENAPLHAKCLSQVFAQQEQVATASEACMQ